MLFEAGLIGYAGFASLTLGMNKHRPNKPLSLMPSRFTAQVLGWALLACAGVVAVIQLGVAQGIIAWIGQICLGGVMMVLLLSWRPRLALQLAPVALIVGLIGVIA
ncbi:DUF3325 domain-containing protein [Sphingobium sp.]|uniref:DUF3325 domain-containing protein n=1 Tax=Sphingobium sp. TaxID=1912891 RepID=UPI003BB75D1C